MRNLSLILLLLVFSCQPKPSDKNRFDDSAVTQLLLLMDSIAARNPGFVRVVAQLDSLPRLDRERRVLALRERNANDPVLQNMIDELLTLEPYRIYFDRFTNVTPDHFRLAFNSLPYAAPNLPGGIADVFYELIRHKETFRQWYTTIRGKIDIQRCVRSAGEWLPPGEHPPTKVYFIYDGNAGSFAEQGSAFFNLCSEVIAKTSIEQRFEHLNEVGVAQLEGVIAHELNHVMAEPVLYPRGLNFSSWEQRWKDRIIRSIVSEGVAFRCNLLTGFQKALWEDRTTLSALIKELNGTMIALDNHELQEDSVQEWHRRLFQEFAASLLEQYLQREYPDSNVKTLAREKAIFRPDLVHTLGWWMVSRITENGTKRERAIELLTHPALLYQRYNESLERGMDDLAVNAKVVAMFAGE